MWAPGCVHGTLWGVELCGLWVGVGKSMLSVENQMKEPKVRDTDWSLGCVRESSREADRTTGMEAEKVGRRRWKEV